MLRVYARLSSLCLALTLSLSVLSAAGALGAPSPEGEAEPLKSSSAAPESAEEAVAPQASLGRRLIDWGYRYLIQPVQGLTFYRSEGESTLQAREAPDGPTFAEGSALLDGWGVKLYLEPSAGWQFGPTFGFVSLKSQLSDFSEALTEDGEELEGELLMSQCRWLNDPTPQPCESPNQYQLKIWSLYGGLSGGYEWLWRPRSTFLFSTELGLSWIPLSLQYTEVSFGDSVRDERFSFEAFNALAGHLALSAELRRRVALSVHLSTGRLGVVRHRPRLEVRGQRYCDALGCTRERAFLRETVLDAWSASVGLSILWGVGADTRGEEDVGGGGE